MAYFYKHLKFLLSNNKIITTDYENYNNSTAGAMLTPKIDIKWTENDQEHTATLGNMITSDMSNGEIKNAFIFRNNITFYNNTTFAGRIGVSNGQLTLEGGTTQGNSPILYINSTQFKFQGVGSGQNGTRLCFFARSQQWASNFYDNPVSFVISDGTTYNKGFSLMTATFDYSTWKDSALSDIRGITSSTSGLNVNFYLTVPTISESSCTYRGNIQTHGNIYSDNLIQGLYFNTTSDIRAKKNIHQSTFSALDIVKQLPIYNFNYNTDDSASIGIIAQEAKDIDLDGFDIVNNKEASGENGDYMTIKESKLVYIAWKAIQEQQEVIEALKKEIEELKAKK